MQFRNIKELDKVKYQYLFILIYLIIVSCDIENWEPDYIAYFNVKEIQLTGLTDKNGIEFNIGYWETNNYKTDQMYKTYTEDTIDSFSPGIDITNISFEKYFNPPIYHYSDTFIDNILTIDISYVEVETD